MVLIQKWLKGKGTIVTDFNMTNFVIARAASNFNYTFVHINVCNYRNFNMIRRLDPLVKAKITRL